MWKLKTESRKFTEPCASEGYSEESENLLSRHIHPPQDNVYDDANFLFSTLHSCEDLAQTCNNL